jgi:hypothetical protein
MVNTFEKSRLAPILMPRAGRPVFRIVSPEPFSRTTLCLEVDWLVSRQRFILIMAACSLFLLASICLGVIVAQAQELRRNGLKTAASTVEHQPSQSTTALHLSLRAADPIDLKDLRAHSTSRDQLTNQRPTGASSRTIETALAATDAAGFNGASPSKLNASLTEEPAGDVSSYGSTRNSASGSLSANPRGAEFSSLAALASTPSPSLLRPMQTKYASMSSGQTDTKLPSNDSGTVVYQLGRVNLVINHLPDSFYLGHSMSVSR